METEPRTHLTHGSDFEELIRELRSGSAEAAEIFAKLYSKHVLRVVRSSFPSAIRSKVDSIDLVNTLFGSMLTNPERFASINSPDQLIALLTVAAKRRVIEEYRKYTRCQSRDVRREVDVSFERAQHSNRRIKNADREESPASRDESPSVIVSSREHLDAVLESLSQRDRQILRLRSNGLNYEQIAAALEGVSARTARRAIASVTERLLG